MPGRMNPPASIRTVMAAAGVLLILCSPAALAGPRLALEPERLDFGEVDRGEKASKILRLANIGDSVLRIEDIRPSCAECMMEDTAASSLAPGQRLDLQITFLAVDVPGKHTAHITLSTNDEREPLRRVYLDVQIKAVDTPRLVVDPEQLDLGVVMAGEPIQTGVVLHNVGEAPLHIRDFTFGPGVGAGGELPGELAPDEKRTLKLTLGPPAPGVLRSHIALVTNQPDRRVATVTMTGYAAKQGQVERLLGGTLVRLTGEGRTVEVVNGTGRVAWLKTDGAQKLMAPGQRVQMPAAEARTGDRIRLMIELPLPSSEVEREGQ